MPYARLPVSRMYTSPAREGEQKIQQSSRGWSQVGGNGCAAAPCMLLARADALTAAVMAAPAACSIANALSEFCCPCVDAVMPCTVLTIVWVDLDPRHDGLILVQVITQQVDVDPLPPAVNTQPDARNTVDVAACITVRTRL